MPLTQLAREIVQLTRRCDTTPVLVTPAYLSLRPRFFVRLVVDLSSLTDDPVRIDIYRDVAGLKSLLRNRITAMGLSSANRKLASLAPGVQGSIQISASIARPGSPSRCLVVGQCDCRYELPDWVTPIRLGAAPSRMAA